MTIDNYYGNDSYKYNENSLKDEVIIVESETDEIVYVTAPLSKRNFERLKELTGKSTKKDVVHAVIKFYLENKEG